jgi:hypothetical protein
MRISSIPISAAVSNLTDMYCDLSTHEVNERMIGHIIGAHFNISNIKQLMESLCMDSEEGGVDAYNTAVANVTRTVYAVMGQLEAEGLIDRLRDGVPAKMDYIPATYNTYILAFGDEMDVMRSVASGVVMAESPLGGIMATYPLPTLLQAVGPALTAKNIGRLLEGEQVERLDIGNVTDVEWAGVQRRQWKTVSTTLAPVAKLLEFIPGASYLIHALGGETFSVTILPPKE